MKKLPFDYYEDERMSQSKLKTYYKCPHLYKKMYVDKTYKMDKSDDLIIGDAVDIIITEGKKEFDKKYEILEPRKKRSDDTDKIQLTNSQGQMILSIAQKTMKQPVMEMFKWMDTQVILGDDKYKAKLDFLGVRRGICYIADYKTCKNIDKFVYDAEDYMYHFQQMFYQEMAKRTIDGIKKFKHYIIASDKTPSKKFMVWEVDQRRFSTERKTWRLIEEHMAKHPNFDTQMIKGICTYCPEELDCPFSLFTKKHIKKI